MENRADLAVLVGFLRSVSAAGTPRYKSCKMTQLLKTLEAKRQSRKKNCNINNEVKEIQRGVCVWGGVKTKAFITNEKRGRASHCKSANNNQLAIAHDLGCAGV